MTATDELLAKAVVRVPALRRLADDRASVERAVLWDTAAFIEELSAALRAERERAARLDRYRVFVEQEMTPGGSEWHNDFEACATYVREWKLRQSELARDGIKGMRERADRLRAHAEAAMRAGSKLRVLGYPDPDAAVEWDAVEAAFCADYYPKPPADAGREGA
jgi:hypothetical protein